jgi:hypothetical protein
MKVTGHRTRPWRVDKTALVTTAMLFKTGMHASSPYLVNESPGAAKILLIAVFGIESGVSMRQGLHDDLARSSITVRQFAHLP